MRILAIDSADRERITAVRVEGDGHAGRSLPGGSVDTGLVPILLELGLAGIDAVVVVVGPGSYTGVRAGMAAGLGLAAAAGLPLHGAGALEVVAQGAPRGTAVIGAVAGAGRGGLYVAGYRREGPGLVADQPVRRVDAAAWRPDPGAGWVALDHRPDGAGAVPIVVADAATALAAAARDAVRRPPLDPARLRAQLGAGGRS